MAHIFLHFIARVLKNVHKKGGQKVTCIASWAQTANIASWAQTANIASWAQTGNIASWAQTGYLLDLVPDESHLYKLLFFFLGPAFFSVILSDWRDPFGNVETC